MKIGLAETSELTDAQFRDVAEVVKTSCGINLGEGKKQLVKARLVKRLRKLGLADFSQYIDYLRRDESGSELTAMLDAISTNLTSFFREIDHFEHLAEDVLPRIAARGAGRLRIWSAGCSSGEEPYSIAITVSKALGDLRNWDAKILATDISTRVLAHAMKGIYTRDRIQTVSPQLRSRYFQCVETRPEKLYRVSDAVRSMICFARLNLMEAWPIKGPFDGDCSKPTGII